MKIEYFRCNGCGKEKEGHKYIPQGRTFPPEDWEIINHGLMVGGSSQDHYCPECAEKRNQERSILFRHFGNITKHLSSTSKGHAAHVETLISATIQRGGSV